MHVTSYIVDPVTYADYYADTYSDDDSLSFYFIFYAENPLEITITGAHKQVCACIYVS